MSGRLQAGSWVNLLHRRDLPELKDRDITEQDGHPMIETVAECLNQLRLDTHAPAIGAMYEGLSADILLEPPPVSSACV
jgi:hypothetical protein